MSNFGMTDSGFNTKRSADIQNEVFDELDVLWEEPVKRSPLSVIGSIVGVLSKPFVVLWETLEGLYFSQNINAASGAHLDNLAQWFTLKRKAPTPTQLIVSGFGSSGTIVPDTSKVSDINGNLYSIVSETTFSAGNYNAVKISSDNLAGVVSRQIVVESSGKTKLFDIVGSFDTFVTSFIAELDAAIVNDELPAGLSVTTGTDEFALTSSGSLTLNVGSLLNLTVNEYGFPLFYVNDKTGVEYCAIGECETVVSGIIGYDSVYNYNNGITGSGWESDDELRARIRLKKRYGSNNIDAISTAIENNVFGITGVYTDENTDIIAVSGIAPHSVMCVVDGGIGYDQDIADIIWIKKGAGIGTSGSVENTVIDRRGNAQKVYFERPNVVYGWVRAHSFEVDPDRPLPAGWELDMQTELVNLASTLSIGDDLVAKRFYGVVFRVGVIDAVVEVGTSLTPSIEPTNWTEDSISISSLEKLIVTTDTVSIDGTF